MSNRRCCGKCKTPYNCGNPGCACHKMNPLDQQAWDRAAAELGTSGARYHMDTYRAARDPDGDDPGLGPTRKNYGE